MNETELIKKIKLLKNIQLDNSGLEDIEKDVYREVSKRSINKRIIDTANNIASLFKSIPLLLFGIAFALILIFFIARAIPLSRLTTASNQYERANIALTDSQHLYGTLSNTDNNIRDLSQSLSLANSELSKLKLKGEKGIYTAQQCHKLYQKYLNYLEEISNNLSQKNPLTISVLKSQIVSYEEQSEIKLHMYSNL